MAMSSTPSFSFSRQLDFLGLRSCATSPMACEIANLGYVTPGHYLFSASRFFKPALSKATSFESAEASESKYKHTRKDSVHSQQNKLKTIHEDSAAVFEHSDNHNTIGVETKRFYHSLTELVENSTPDIGKPDMGIAFAHGANNLVHPSRPAKTTSTPRSDTTPPSPSNGLVTPAQNHLNFLGRTLSKELVYPTFHDMASRFNSRSSTPPEPKVPKKSRYANLFDEQN